MILSLLLPFFICFALIVGARQLTVGRGWEKVIRFTVGYSFGIYLFHMSVIYLVKPTIADQMGLYPLISTLVCVALVGAISVTWLVRKCRLGFMIGE